MKTCVIFGAAEFDSLIRPIGSGDHLIAADGGLIHTERLQILPHDVLGDFDSLDHIPEGAHVYPVEKDDTDTMLAIRRGLALGFRSFLIYGGLDGPRLDHTVANFQALHYLACQKAFGILVGNNQLAAVIQNGSLRFPEGLRGTVSVFCMGPDAAGVDLEGLYYPLQDGALSSAFPLGVSNHFTGQPACIRVRTGTLLVIWDRSCGLPEEADCTPGA